MSSNDDVCRHIVIDESCDDLLLFPGAFTDRADYLLDYFQKHLAWHQPEIKLYGKPVKIPRMQAWYGDKDAGYRYSGLQLEPIPWDSELIAVKERVETLTGASFNSVLTNLYRDGGDGVGWHSDDESELGPDPVIASVTFGAVRRFVLRHKKNKYKDIELLLPHGSLLLMGKGVQLYWKHQLPKTKKVVGVRVNLTYRYCVNKRGRSSQ